MSIRGCLKTLSADYSRNGNYIQLSLPNHTETLIPVDDSVRLIDQVLEEIDYRELYLTYLSEGRNPAVSPKTLAASVAAFTDTNGNDPAMSTAVQISEIARVNRLAPLKYNCFHYTPSAGFQISRFVD